MAGLQEPNNQQQGVQEPGNQQQGADRRQNMRDALAMAVWNASRINPHLTFAMDSAMQGMQNHSNASNAINSAISNEMDSRVAQQREMRRMAHEKEMMRMRLEAQRRDEEGGIIRSLLNG